MIVEYQQSDGSLKLFGYMMSDGPLSAASGQLVRGWHHLCYWVAKKREARGGTVTGRVVAGAPTGYDIQDFVLTRDDINALGITPEQARERGTVVLSARVALLREVAEKIGKGVGDPQVQEAFAAAEHGGPYVHHHQHRLDTYQLIAHLKFAHGLDEKILASSQRGLQDQHSELHARAAQQAIADSRTADEDAGPVERDWREQHTAEL